MNKNKTWKKTQMFDADYQRKNFLSRHTYACLLRTT